MPDQAPSSAPSSALVAATTQPPDTSTSTKVITLPPHMSASTSSGTRNPPLAVSISPALASDAGAIATMGANTFRRTFGWSRPTATIDDFIAAHYSEASMSQSIAQNTVFVARDGSQKIVGFVELVPGGTDPCLPDPETVAYVRLKRIYVDVGAAGSGVGGRLWERAEEWTRGWFGREEGEGRGRGRRWAMWLGVWEHHPRAQKLYQRWGFEKVGEQDFEVGGDVDTDWVMMKWLS